MLYYISFWHILTYWLEKGKKIAFSLLTCKLNAVNTDTNSILKNSYFLNTLTFPLDTE